MAGWLVLTMIVLVRIPFLLVHPLQEDAYITFRAARHLAEYGDFSFNLHQHFPGTTSVLYPLIVAAIDLLTCSHMVLGVEFFGTLCAAGACWFIARALCDRPAEQHIVSLLTACWPIALVMSYTGMETPLLALALGTSIFALARESHWTLFAVSVLLLPLIRPDAIVERQSFDHIALSKCYTLTPDQQRWFKRTTSSCGASTMCRQRITRRLSCRKFSPWGRSRTTSSTAGAISRGRYSSEIRSPTRRIALYFVNEGLRSSIFTATVNMLRKGSARLAL